MKSQNNKIGNMNIKMIFDKVKMLPRKILLPLIAGILVLIIVTVILLTGSRDTYKSPLKKSEKQLNTNKLSVYVDNAFYDGIADIEVREALNAIKNSDFYQELIEPLEEGFEFERDYIFDKYGEGVKFKYIIYDKEELEREDLRKFAESLDELSEALEEAVEQLEELDSNEFEEVAEDEIGVSKSELKALLKIFEKASKKYKSAKVTEGYVIDATLMVSGIDLDEPEEIGDEKIYVYKVNGKWVDGNASYLFRNLL